MKRTNSTAEFKDERNAEVMLAYRAASAAAPSENLLELSARISRMPASRFWVSTERACAVMSCMERGIDILATMRPSKQRLYREIHRRMPPADPSDPRPLCHRVEDAIYSPAPEFYMEPLTVADIIYKTIRARRKNGKRG